MPDKIVIECEPEYFEEYMNQLGYKKVVTCDECKYNPMKNPTRHHHFQWCWYDEDIGYCQKGKKQ